MKNYLKAARLRTLPLSISGIIVGSFIASSQNFFDIKICILALLTTIGFQVLSNFANDYGDGVKGTDKNRVGEQRLVASGVITPKQMKKAIIFATIMTLIVAMLLIYVSFGKENFRYSLLFFTLGVISIIAAIKYTVGNNAYGYNGFGDIFVFLFFGPLSVIGSYFLFTKHINSPIFLPAFSIGLLSTSVLNLNNMRDRENDQKVKKYTLVVKIGAYKSKIYHYFLIIFALVFSIIYVLLDYRKPIQYLFLIAFIPLLKHLFFVSKNNKELLLDGELKKVALSTFLFAVLFGLSQIL